MSRPIFGLLWRRHRVSMALCVVVPILMGVVMGLIYPTWSRQRALLEAMPIPRKFLGGGQVDLLSPEGAFTLPFQHPLCLVIIALIAAIPATGLPAGERGRKSLDLLLAAPLERRALMLTVAGFSGLAAVAVGVAGLAGAALGGAIAGVAGDLPWALLPLVVLNTIALAAVFGAGALAVSAAAADRGGAAIWYGAAAFVALLLDVTARLWQDGQWLRWCTPYGYLRPAATVSPNGAVWGAVWDTLWLAGIAAALLSLAVRAETRRKHA